MKKISKPRPSTNARSQELAKIRREDVVFVDLNLDSLVEEDLEIYVALQALRGELKTLMAAGRPQNRMAAIRLRELSNWANSVLAEDQSVIRAALVIDEDQHILEQDARRLQTGWLDTMHEVAFHLADTKGNLDEASWGKLQILHERCAVFEGGRLNLERARADGVAAIPLRPTPQRPRESRSHMILSSNHYRTGDGLEGT